MKKNSSRFKYILENTKVVVDPNMEKHGNAPFFVKKAEQAKEALINQGLAEKLNKLLSELTPPSPTQPPSADS